MRNVKRFYAWSSADMAEDENGRFVLASDYDALASRLAEAERRANDQWERNERQAVKLAEAQRLLRRVLDEGYGLGIVGDINHWLRPAASAPEQR